MDEKTRSFHILEDFQQYCFVVVEPFKKMEYEGFS
jgi:hypothetical protein